MSAGRAAGARAPRRQPLRALRRAGVVRLAVQRLRRRRRHRRPDCRRRRARRRAVRRRRRRVLRSARARSPRSSYRSIEHRDTAPEPPRRRRAAVGPARRARRDRRDPGPDGEEAAPGSPSPTPTATAATSSSAWMRDLGLDVAIDAIGNVVATRPGTDPAAAPVMTGSHIDTVRTGGRFDGNLGVLAGLEVIETLEQHGVATEHPVAVGLLHRRGGRPLRARHARQPRVRRRDGARGGARRRGRRRRRPPRRRAGPHRLRRAAAVPDGRRAARLRRAAHRAGADPRGRGRSRSASSRACRASRGPS